MSHHPAFQLLAEETIPEANSLARHYRHVATGAEVVSLVNDDENKVFGITFKTPPADSTGIAHILEHSVLCGSEKYRVKKPFVELIKGSMHTFLNAMTFPDKTAYPVASQNLADFYNLVDVYLDAVFFPLLSEDTFRQEGWHYELEGANAPLIYKGVVFNEMKGAWSSPDALLHKTAQAALYPDTVYGQSSGGDPEVMPELSYEAFRRFHETYYHPSNARAFFSGDDDPARRLDLLDQYFSRFPARAAAGEIGLQPRFDAPRRIEAGYAGTRGEGRRRDGMASVSWMLDPPADRTEALGNALLSYILVGTPAAPLRKALTDSGLGEGLTGSGISPSLRQPMGGFGLKGIDPADAGKVEALILATLERLTADGIDRGTVEAALNTFEFSLRENNTGSFPRGISLMFSALSSWLHAGDPLEALRFETALAEIKARAEKGYFEALIRGLFLENPHRVTVVLSADEEKGAREAAEERARLDAVRAGMSEEAVAETIAATRALKALQEEEDDPAELAKIPSLRRADLDPAIRTVPTEAGELMGARLFTHELPTLGIAYLDIGFDLSALEPELVPYLGLFGRALLQTGTGREDFVALSQRIGRLTGGVSQHRALSMRQGGAGLAAWFFLSGKAVGERVPDLFAILRDVVLEARLGDRARFRQLALEEKAGLEARLVPGGNGFVDLRLRAGFNPAGWAAEQMGGVSYLEFVRGLVARIDGDWEGVEAALGRIRTLLVDRARMVVNVTADSSLIPVVEAGARDFLSALPMGSSPSHDWGIFGKPGHEGLSIPAQVNFVGKGADLRALGYVPTGAASVALKYLNTTYLWDRIRVQGGAYGGSSRLEPVSGGFTFLSYRDPNLLGTLDVYDGAASALRGEIGETELTRSIIGTIGDMDPYQFPDAKGYSALWRILTGTTDALRQQRRDEVLGASLRDFRVLGDALDAVRENGRVVVMGNAGALEAANAERAGFLSLRKVM